MATLTVTPGDTVTEGENAIFYISLSSPLAESVFFRASTITTGGASVADGNYAELKDKIHEIPAGQTEFQISVQTYNAGSVNEGTEAVGLWVDDVYPPTVTIADNGVGAGRGFVTILDTIPPIKLSVQNATANEGNNLGFTVRAEEPVPQNTLVYLQVQASTTAGIADGFWWVGGMIDAGKTSTTVFIKTLSDDLPGDRQVDVKLISYHEDAIITDDTAVGTVRNTTTEDPNLPIVSLYGVTESELREGHEGWFTVQSDRASGSPITVGIEVVSGRDDITVLNDTVTFTPTAGKLHDFIRIEPKLDANDTEGNETFTIRLKAPSDGSFVVGSSNTVTTTILDEPAVGSSALTQSDLVPWKNLFDEQATVAGANNFAGVVSNDRELSIMGKTLDALGMLLPSIKSAITWIFDVIPYAEAEELPSIGLTENQIMQGYRLMTWANPEDNPTRNISMEWTSQKAKDTGGLGLMAGDFVDGRLVLDELPVFWSGVAERDGYIGTRSIQGRDSSGNKDSHTDDFMNSLDISPVAGKTMYVVAPATGTVRYMENTATRASDNSGPSNLGNVVTLELDQTTASGKPIFMTFSHMETGSVPVTIGQSVVAGQVLGIVGDTGGNWDKHLHFQVGTELRNEGLHPSNNKIVDGNGVKDDENTPPIYFSTFQQDGRVTVYGGPEQDLGFPISGSVPLITGINPTFTQEEFDTINPTLPGESTTQPDTGGQGGDFPTQDPVWNGTSAAETNEYWEGKVSNVNEFINAGAGYDFILGSDGNDVINGEADGGQVNLFGPGAIRANFSVTTLNDGGYQVRSIDGAFDTDRYYNIDGIWFGGYGEIPGAWYNLPDLVINTFDDGDGALPSTGDQVFDELFNGTSNKDLITGGTGIDWFMATQGDDILFGGNGKDDDPSWNQVNFNTTPFSEVQWGYDIASDLLFSRHSNLGLDVYDSDITDFWFAYGGWHGRAELVGLASDTFVFV